MSIKFALIKVLLLGRQYFHFFSFIAFLPAVEDHNCRGAEKRQCIQPSLEYCAKACQNISSMFVFGKQGGDKCYGNKCECSCQMDAFRTGTCKLEYNSNFNLFKYHGMC